MSENNRDILNTGIVKAEYVKNAIHYFCAAAELENSADVVEGARCVEKNIINYSAASTEREGVKPVTIYENILEYFFNQKNIVPAHVYCWLDCYYSGTMGRIPDYKNKHLQTYHTLQQEYIKRYRYHKQDEKDNEYYEKQRRRSICKMYRNGEHSELFRLYNTSFSDIMSEKEIDEIGTLIYDLFHRELGTLSIIEDRVAAAYVLGRIQGRADNKIITVNI